MGHAVKPEPELMNIICPKCGYEQEERLDCLKCGIVFSKFNAFYPADKPSRPESVEPPYAAQLPPDDGQFSDLVEVRQQLRDLSRRFSEVEFERVERGQIRTELRSLDRKFQSEIERMALRLETLEMRENKPQVPPPLPAERDHTELKKDLRETYYDPLLLKLSDIEGRLTKVAEESRQDVDPQILEMLKILDVGVGELEKGLETLRAEVASNDPTKTVLELQRDLRSLQAEVCAGNGAVGELENKLRSMAADLAAKDPTSPLQCLRQDLESLKSNIRLHEAALELSTGHGDQISQLRARADHTQERIQSLEETVGRLLKPSAGELLQRPLDEDVRAICESLDQIRQFVTRLGQKT